MGQSLTEDVHVKFSKEDLALLADVCKQRGETLSAFIRVATHTQLARLGLLPESRRKALGVTESGGAEETLQRSP
jgi:hypothetical protein